MRGPPPRRVRIVADHPIVRHGLRAMIDAESDMQVCGEVQSARDGRAAIRALAPDAVVVDLSLSVKRIESHYQSIRRKLNPPNNARPLQYAIKWHATVVS